MNLHLLILVIALGVLTIGGTIAVLMHEKAMYPETINPDQKVASNQGDLPVFITSYSTMSYGESAAPKNIGVSEQAFYTKYVQVFVKQNGAIISNYQPVSWCTNGCIGCDEDVSSEAVARLALYAVQTSDKVTFDREVSYYYNTMMHPQTGHMMWKLNSDGSVGSCGGKTLQLMLN
ncbi:hypothetical protein M0R04_09835 [Candidatus Dojkabacteria bacterium]|jgi:hypothetical protein|nr:hypothetical protein [Candidatus Dojkabacteria bacterium]